MNNAKYWEGRFQQLEKSRHSDNGNKYREIEKQFMRSQQAIENKINAWYGRFASNNGITLEEARKMLNSSELEELKWDVDEYIKAGKKNALTKQFKKQLENASAKYHINRLEAIKLQTQMECEKLYGNFTDALDEYIKSQYTDTYYKTAFEIQKGLGYGHSLERINSDMLEQIANKPWAVDGKNFKTRLGESKVKLINNVHNSLTQMCLMGTNPEQAIRTLAKTMQGDRGRAGRIIMTESAYFSQNAQKRCFNSLGVEEYEIVATLDSRTCGGACAGQDGEHYPMKMFEPGVTAPPFHPNCVTEDMVVYSPDAEAVTRSEYSGDIFEFFTSNGRRLSVTPNHIMLTARGWVRAKNISKSDKIIYYSGNISNYGLGEPTNNYSSSTIKDLFGALWESGNNSTVSMPMSSVDFKGDGIPNGKVDIVDINSKLRNELNSAVREFICDSNFIFTGKAFKVDLPIECSVAEFLMGIGLAADGVMSIDSVLNILSLGSMAHHKFISRRTTADYNVRLNKTAVDDRTCNAQMLSNGILTNSAFIHLNNFESIDSLTGIFGDSSSDTICVDDADYRLPTDTERIGNLLETLSGIIECDDVVDIRCRKVNFTHVYDISSSSTLYLCNGFITSNCRCCTAPYFNDEWSKGERAARDEDGEIYYVPSDMNYKDWKRTYVYGHTEDLNQKTDILDRMGKPQLFTAENAKIKAYEVDGLSNVFTQTNTKDAQNTIDSVRVMQENGIIKDVSSVIVSKDLAGVAAYDHVNNRLFINEKLTNNAFIKNELTSGYFVAQNFEEAIKHEMFHKKHWDYIMTKGDGSAIIKKQIESELHKYVAQQQHYDINYIEKNVSKNASYSFNTMDSLNELIAEVLLQEDIGTVSDFSLLEMVKRCTE